MLHIVHLNDTEGPITEVWPPVATAVRALREAGRCDVLLHAGDVPLGSPAAEATVRIMNTFGFDAVALGNHDLNDGVGALCAQAQRLQAPILCANVSGAPPGCVRPYRWLRRRGLRVAVIGITLPDLPLYQAARLTSGLTFHPAAEVLRALVPRLRPHAAVVVVLSHCGYDADVELARHVPGIDLIVGGHNHQLVPAPVAVGRTWVVQAGAEGAYVGWLAVQHEGRLEVTGGLLPMAGLAPDAHTLALGAPAVRDAATLAVVGYTATDLSSATYAQETPLGNLTADLMRAYAGTDLALLRCATVINSLGAGPIRQHDLSQLNHCGTDQVARLYLTGQELVKVLECGARGEYFLLTTSGARVTYDAARPEGQRVVAVQVSDQLLDREQRYSVACSEVLAHGTGGFLPLRGKRHELLPHTIAELLAEHIMAHDAIRPTVDGRLVLHGRLPGARCCQSPRPAHDLEGATHGLDGLLPEHLRALVAESPQRA